jgi:outer membrane protein assembly factor BamB
MAPGNASPLVVGHRLFDQRTFNSPLEGRAEVQSVDRLTGRDLRRVTADAEMHPMFRHASPILYKGCVLAAGSGLLVIDPAEPDAYQDWFHLSPRIGMPGQRYAASSTTPAAADGVAYVSYHREIVAHDLAAPAGEPRWRIDHEPGLLHTSGSFRSRYGTEPPFGAYASPLIGRDKLIVCDTGGRVRCLARDDGRELWRLNLGQPVWAAPIASGNTLWVADYFGGLHALAW